MFDAHIHFPIKQGNPYESLMDELQKNSVKEFLLILNSKEEFELFKKNQLRFIEDGFLPRIALLLDIKEKYPLEDFEWLETEKIAYAVKIHPIITQLTRDDIPLLISELSHLSSKTIIVDNWIFGPYIQHFIGTEIAIELAKQFPQKNIVMAHAGGVRLLETMLITRPIKNLYFDCSQTCKYFDGTSVEGDFIHFLRYTYSRIMFGSDYPTFTIEDSFSAFLKHCQQAAMSEEQILDISHNLALRIYQ